MKLARYGVFAFSAVFLLTGCNHTNNKVNNKVDLIAINLLNSQLSECSDIKVPYDAIKYLKEEKNIDIDNFKLSSGNSLAFDNVNKCFISMKGENVITTPLKYNKPDNLNIFKVTDYYDASSTYSQYLTRNFEGTDILVATTGVDTGANKNIYQIIYNNTTGTKKDVILNTFCDYLTIVAPLDNVTHYGDTNNIFVVSVGDEYREFGYTAYIQCEDGNIYLEKGSSTDLFEIKEGCTVTTNQAEGANVVIAINADDVTTGKKLVYREVKDVSSLDSAVSEAIASDEQKFIRLTADIDYNETEERKYNCLDISNDTFIDLNGKSLKFKSENPIDIGDGEYKEKLFVGLYVHNSDTNKNVECYIVDTQSTLYHRSGLYFDDCSFLIKGDVESDNLGENSANLYFDSGKIHNIRNSVSKAYCGIVVGNTEDKALSDRKYKNATLNMYGGYIKTERGASYSGANFKCLQPRGKGAVINMRYGDIESENYCISGQGVNALSSNPKYDAYGGTIVNITGGTLVGGYGESGTNKYEYTPLFFPQSGVVNISDAKVIANKSTCLNAKRGIVNIDSGTFIAYGDVPAEQPHADVNGTKADGSVFFFEVNGGYKFDPEYTELWVNVNDGKFYSKNNRIVTISGYKTTDNYAKCRLNFMGGNYYYKTDDIYIDNQQEHPLIEGTQYDIYNHSGTWTKI